MVIPVDKVSRSVCYHKTIVANSNTQRSWNMRANHNRWSYTKITRGSEMFDHKQNKTNDVSHNKHTNRAIAPHGERSHQRPDPRSALSALFPQRSASVPPTCGSPTPSIRVTQCLLILQTGRSVGWSVGRSVDNYPAIRAARTHGSPRNIIIIIITFRGVRPMSTSMSVAAMIDDNLHCAGWRKAASTFAFWRCAVLKFARVISSRWRFGTATYCTWASSWNTSNSYLFWLAGSVARKL